MEFKPFQNRDGSVGDGDGKVSKTRRVEESKKFVFKENIIASAEGLCMAFIKMPCLCMVVRPS